MRRGIHSFMPVMTALVALAHPAAASANEYADRGVIEIGGAFGLTFDSRDVQPSGGSSDLLLANRFASHDYLDLEASPQIAVFVARGFSINGGLVAMYRLVLNDLETESKQLGVSLGAGYRFRIGTLFAGPEIGIQYLANEGSAAGDSTWGIATAFELKVPIGGGLVALGPRFSSRETDYFGFTVRTNRLSLALGYSIYF